MSKATSNKVSELKSLRKDASSVNQQSQKEDKISEIKSINKDMINKEENEVKSKNQGVQESQENPLNDEENQENQDNQQKQELTNNKDKVTENISELKMKESIKNEDSQMKDIIGNNSENQSQIQKLQEQLNDKDKMTLKSAQEDHESNTKEELEKKRKKLLMTEVSNAFDNKDFFNFHDLIVPGGKNASLCLVNEPFNKNLRVSDIADHFKFIEPQQVIVLIGANTRRKVKLMAGISRAALNTRAIILDSGLQTGIEKFCLRKNLTLIGIAPENKIEYPKINPEEFSSTLLTNGHTHFILLGKDDKSLNWGQEAKFKVNFAERLANGRKGAFPYKAKVVGIVFGNIPNCTDECLMFIEKKWPLILVEDSDFCQFVKESREAPSDDEANKYGDKIALIGKYSKLIEIDDDSENLAASIHICLTLSF